MAKIINEYRAFAAAGLKSRATIPDAGDMTIVGTTVECSAIDVGKIATSLGISVYDFYGQATDVAVNHWSGFGPTLRSVVAGVLTNEVNANPRGLDLWAGYNHYATAPGYPGAYRTNSVEVLGSGGTATKSLSITIGEPKYVGGEINAMPDAVGVCLALYDHFDNLVGYNIVDLEVCSEGADLVAVSDVISATETLTGRIFLVDSLITFDASHIICSLPGLEEFHFDAVVLLANHIDISPDSFVTADDTALEAADCSFTKNGGGSGHATLTFPSIHRHSNNAGIVIYANLVHQITGTVDSIIIYDDTLTGGYIADTVIPGATIEFSIAITSDYGYTFQLLIEESA
jgi:hypothetical protein